MSATKKQDSNQNSQRSLMPLFLYKILKEKSSADNPLTQKQISQILSGSPYKIEIGENDRKALPRCIKTLSLAYPNLIVETAGKKGTPTSWYFDFSHDPMPSGNVFSNEEATMFVDMVSGLKIISRECSTALIHKFAASMDNKPVRFGYKSENNELYKFRDKIEEAIKKHREVTFTYRMEKKERLFTVIPVSIKYIDGNIFLDAFTSSGKPQKFDLSNIVMLAIGKKAASCDPNEEIELEDDTSKSLKSIGLDALFSNLTKIKYAIHNQQKLKFEYLGYTIKDNKLRLVTKSEETVYPLDTAFKGDKYYLIAVNVNEKFKPVFFRIDLMASLEYDSTLDFIERRRFDAKDTHEYVDAHPYMLSGFSQIGVRFKIDITALDRVIDAFGNNAIPCGEVKGWETAGKNARLLAAKYSELDFSEYLGLSHNGTYAEFRVETSEDEAFRFALENADVVEIEAPKHLRDRILEVSKKVKNRYSKKKD